MNSPVGAQTEGPGPGDVIVKVSEFEAPAPGLTTAMVAVPAAAIRLAGTAAVNCVALTKVVVSDVVFHRTIAPSNA